MKCLSCLYKQETNYQGVAKGGEVVDEYEVEMDRIFRETDFAAENHDLKERLWQRLQEKAARRQQEPLKIIDEDRELSDEELTRLAAAGSIFTVKKT